MSPERTEYYRAKQRRMAFYIVENENNNEENPPTVSAVIGLDKELEGAFLASKRPILDKPAMKTGMRINRDVVSDKKEKETVKIPLMKKNGMHCPSVPTQWRNNLDIIIPKAEFGYFLSKRK